MVLEQLMFCYQNPLYLNYLRYNPRWYKILYYNPDAFLDFIKEANTHMHLTTKDRFIGFNKKLSFVSSLLGYLAKK